MKPWTQQTNGRTHARYVCMRGFYFVGTARMDRKRPGLNAPGIGLRAFCSCGGSMPPHYRQLRHGLSPMPYAQDLFPHLTLRRFPRRGKSEIILQDPRIYGLCQLEKSFGLSNRSVVHIAKSRISGRISFDE